MKKQDCNIKNLKEISKAALEFAIDRYKCGNLSDDMYLQLTDALLDMKHWAQQSVKPKRKGTK